jgi:hypothetical protein
MIDSKTHSPGVGAAVVLVTVLVGVRVRGDVAVGVVVPPGSITNLKLAESTTFPSTSAVTVKMYSVGVGAGSRNWSTAIGLNWTLPTRKGSTMTSVLGDDLRFGHYAPAIAGVRYVFGLGADRF